MRYMKIRVVRVVFIFIIKITLLLSMFFVATLLATLNYLRVVRVVFYRTKKEAHLKR